MHQVEVIDITTITVTRISITIITTDTTKMEATTDQMIAKVVIVEVATEVKVKMEEHREEQEEGVGIGGMIIIEGVIGIKTFLLLIFLENVTVFLLAK